MELHNIAPLCVETTVCWFNTIDLFLPEALGEPDFSGCCRGVKQQRKTDRQKSLRLSDLRSSGDRPVLHDGRASRAEAAPQILLKRPMGSGMSLLRSRITGYAQTAPITSSDTTSPRHPRTAPNARNQLMNSEDLQPFDHGERERRGWVPDPLPALRVGKRRQLPRSIR